LNNRENVYMSKREYDRAIQDYDEAIKLDPSEPLYLKNRANAFRITGQYGRAVADFRKALTLKVDGRSRPRSRNSAR
jgi:tetratricopeptide (TPR) repeat protein